MAVLIFFMLSSLLFLHTEGSNADYQAAKCSDDAPNVRFPFRAQDLQPRSCGYPNFELFCKENKTIIRFSSYGYLEVKSISYGIKKLDLLDPKACVHEVFLNLDLSHTPFRYYYVVKNYTYLNCSKLLSSDFEQVPCLSGSDYHVYVVEPFQDLPASCKAVKTVAIPFSYSAYLADNSFGLGLTWDSTEVEYSEENGGWSKIQSKYGKVLSITIFIFMVATLIGVKTYCSEKLDRQNREKIHIEVQKLLGEGETKLIPISKA